MTWTSFNQRAEVLREVIAAADLRLAADALAEAPDGALPVDLPTDVVGVREAFGTDRDLLGALQLKWHTRLAGRIESAQQDEPMDLRESVVRAWQDTARELPGVRAVIDHQRRVRTDQATVDMLRTSAAKEHVLLAVMAGLASAGDQRAVGVGAGIEQEARAALRDARSGDAWPGSTAVSAMPSARVTLLHRLKAALAA